MFMRDYTFLLFENILLIFSKLVKGRNNFGYIHAYLYIESWMKTE